MINKDLSIKLLLFAVIVFEGCAVSQKYFPAPGVLPNTERNMKVGAFWISQLSDPDKLILGPKGIKSFNSFIRGDLKLVTDIGDMPQTVSGMALKVEITTTFQRFKNRKLYFKSLRKVEKSFYDDIEKNMSLNLIGSNVDVKFAIITHFCDQRLLPFEEPLYAKTENLDFDVLENNSLDLGTPIAILQTSSNGMWVYAQSPYSSGWIDIRNVALCSQKDLRVYSSKEPFIVVAKTKGEIYSNSEMSKYLDFVRMGCRLPVDKKINKNAFTIIIPIRKEDGAMALEKAFIPRKEGELGYIPYTKRNVISQEFEMVNMPYCWGGAQGEQDCSGFVQQVFLPFGIILPKNSAEQAKVGILLGKFDKNSTDDEKLSVLKDKSRGGITTLFFQGHIMIFLGFYNNAPYVMHDIWGYSSKSGSEERANVINKIVVTDLTLGEGTKKGALLKRLTTVRLVEY